MGQQTKFDSNPGQTEKNPSARKSRIKPNDAQDYYKNRLGLSTLSAGNFSLESLDFQNFLESLPEGIIICDSDSGRVIHANQAACSMHGYMQDEFIGLHPSKFLDHGSSWGFQEIQEKIKSGEPYATEATNLRRDGTPFITALNFLPIHFEKHKQILGIIHPLDEHLYSKDTNQFETRTGENDQSRLIDFAQKLSDSLEFDANSLLLQVYDFIPFEAAVLFRLNEGTLNPIGFSNRGKPGSFDCPILPINQPEVFEILWTAQTTIRINSKTEISGKRTSFFEFRNIKLPGVFEKMQSQLWAPLIKDERLVGLLGFGHSEINAYQDRHSSLAMRISNLLVNTIVNSERFSQVQASAAQEERRALARNLHNAVNQSLFSAGLIAEVLPHVWAKDQGEGKKSLEDLRRLTRGAQAEIRMMLVELRHSKLIDVEIADLLHLLANAFTGRTNIPVVEDILKDNSLPPNIQKIFYHFCQEALNNIVKHSEATQVHIVFKRRDKSYFLCVRDNGCGFDRRKIGLKRERKVVDSEVREKSSGLNPKLIPPGHYGLRMMDELARSVGAKLCIETRPGQGTSISIHWKNTP